MPQELRVQAPPSKPLLLFDGECQFCRRWIARWKNSTGDAVDYVPFQNAEIVGRFPEIPPAELETAVHLIMPDGKVSRGAHAVLEALAAGKAHRWLFYLYRKFSPFADLAELIYDEVSGHRMFLSHLDGIYSGFGAAPSSYIGVRFLFLRGLALIYLIAFISLAGQIQGLIGSHGIVPAPLMMDSVKHLFEQENIGAARFHALPTFAWWGASDQALNWQCGLGIGCSIALLFGIAPALMLFLLWALYLSLCSISSPFLDFQWDLLLLETGFLAIFFAPLQLFERPSRQRPPPALVVWLLRWLLFRLMFESGCVKLLSGDLTWWNLTALKVHFQTQPLPTWTAWYVHQLPPRVLAISQFIMLAIELVVPPLIFCGRRMRVIAASALIFLQVVILLTGNYTFFNWLTILLCVPLLDDRIVRIFAHPIPAISRSPRWPWFVSVCLAALVGTITFMQFLAVLRERQQWPKPVLAVYTWLEPFRSFNSYGLFAVMTQKRPEIVIEGSADGKEWLPYEFKYKPGDLDHKPAFVAPFQPRLDWQMWFAALSDWHHNLWILRLEMRLLQNSPPVEALLQHNPFPSTPPRYVRALLYEYHFTDATTRRMTGAWWRRELIGAYTETFTLEDFKRAKVPGS